MKPQQHVSLQAHNTLGVLSSAQHAVEATHDQALVDAAQWAAQQQLPFTLLGGGSNVILGPELPGLVALVRTRGITTQASGESVLVRAKAGENWHGLVRYSLGQGLSGLQTLALIPGSVGAAPIQNIGAYGTELADVFESLTAYDREQQTTVVMDRADCAFGYRDSLFKRETPGRFVILEVCLRLQSQWQAPPLSQLYVDVARELITMGTSLPQPVHIAEAVCRVRRRKLPDPRHHGNVGSVFKNPVVTKTQAQRLQQQLPELVSYEKEGGMRLSAAQLIDQVGGKQMAVEGAYVWPRQPLVLVQGQRQDPPTAKAFCELLEQLRAAVAQRFEITLEAEPQRLG